MKNTARSSETHSEHKRQSIQNDHVALQG